MIFGDKKDGFEPVFQRIFQLADKPVNFRIVKRVELFFQYFLNLRDCFAVTRNDIVKYSPDDEHVWSF
jgi:hypothetical protein